MYGLGLLLDSLRDLEDRPFRARLREALKDVDFSLDYHSFRESWKRSRLSDAVVRGKVLRLLSRFESLSKSGKRWAPQAPNALLYSARFEPMSELSWNRDFAFLVGAYFGNLRLHNGTRLSLTVKEREVAETIHAAVQRFSREPVKWFVNESTNGRIRPLYRFSHSNPALVHYLETATRRGKNVPLNQLNSKELKIAFLQGLVYSGGGLKQMKQRPNFLSIRVFARSNRVAEQSALVLASLGILPTFHTFKNGSELYVNQFEDLKKFRPLNVFPSDKQATLNDWVQKNEPARNFISLEEFEESLRLRRTRGKIVGPDSHMPYRAIKLSNLVNLSREYHYSIPWLLRFPLSTKLSTERHQLRGGTLGVRRRPLIRMRG